MPIAIEKAASIFEKKVLPVINIGFLLKVLVEGSMMLSNSAYISKCLNYSRIEYKENNCFTGLNAAKEFADGDSSRVAFNAIVFFVLLVLAVASLLAQKNPRERVCSKPQTLIEPAQALHYLASVSVWGVTGPVSFFYPTELLDIKKMELMLGWMLVIIASTGMVTSGLVLFKNYRANPAPIPVNQRPLLEQAQEVFVVEENQQGGGQQLQDLERPEPLAQKTESKVSFKN